MIQNNEDALARSKRVSTSRQLVLDKKAPLNLVCIMFLDHADDKICILLNNSLIFFSENAHSFTIFQGCCK